MREKFWRHPRMASLRDRSLSPLIRPEHSEEHPAKVLAAFPIDIDDALLDFSGRPLPTGKRRGAHQKPNFAVSPSQQRLSELVFISGFQEFQALQTVFFGFEARHFDPCIV
jgi:hypothetical protein